MVFPGLLQTDDFLFQKGKALVEGFVEALLFFPDHPDHEVPARKQLGKVFAHLVDHVVGRLAQKDFGHADEPAEAIGPADQPTQHVAAPFVRGHDPVRDHEGDGPTVVGNDPQGRIHVVGVRRAAAVFHSGQIRRVGDDLLEQVTVKVRIHPLAHG